MQISQHSEAVITVPVVYPCEGFVEVWIPEFEIKFDASSGSQTYLSELLQQLLVEVSGGLQAEPQNIILSFHFPAVFVDFCLAVRRGHHRRNRYN